MRQKLGQRYLSQLVSLGKAQVDGEIIAKLKKLLAAGAARRGKLVIKGHNRNGLKGSLAICNSRSQGIGFGTTVVGSAGSVFHVATHINFLIFPQKGGAYLNVVIR